MKKTLFVLFLLLNLPTSQTVANKIETKKFQNTVSTILPVEPQKQPKYKQKAVKNLPFVPKYNEKMLFNTNFLAGRFIYLNY